MNQDPELLCEMINLIVDELLHDDYFCGSIAGRRIRELRWEMMGGPIKTTLPKSTPRCEMVSSTLVLPLMLDAAVSVAAEKSGVARDVLIAGVLESMLAEHSV